MTQHAPKDWSDSPSTSTPITAAELERMEWGIADADKFWTPPVVVGKARNGIYNPANQWVFVDSDRGYFYPVWYAETWSTDGLGLDLRGTASGSAILGVYDSSNGGYPGVAIAQTTVSMASSGWKDLGITTAGPFAPGWYWHASTYPAGLDVYAGVPMAQFDTANMEKAIRNGEYATRGLRTTGAFTSFTSNPTLESVNSLMPIIGVRFA